VSPTTATNKLGEQTNAQTETGTSTQMQSALNAMHELGTQVAIKSHNAFLPPYSWMMKLGLMGLEAEYKKAMIVDDVPRLLNQITGYYAGAPDAIQVAKRQESEGDAGDLLNVISRPIISMF
jgi:hypothetical protein